MGSVWLVEAVLALVVWEERLISRARSFDPVKIFTGSPCISGPNAPEPTVRTVKTPTPWGEGEIKAIKGMSASGGVGLPLRGQAGTQSSTHTNQGPQSAHAVSEFFPELVLNGELSAEDIGALTDICKSAHGLSEQQAIAPLTRDHVPVKATGSAPVSLLSIFHHRGVNALAEDQILRFGPYLTVVYGDNAAGKTGYIRILKSACRARRQEQILAHARTDHAIEAI